MAHNTLIDGTVYEITDGTGMVSATNYDIAFGVTRLDGTEYLIPFDGKFAKLTLIFSGTQQEMSQEAYVEIHDPHWDYSDGTFELTGAYDETMVINNGGEYVIGVPFGTKLNLRVYSSSQYAYALVYLNGTQVFKGAGEALRSYTHEITTDTTITMKDYKTGTRYYDRMDITEE